MLTSIGYLSNQFTCNSQCRDGVLRSCAMTCEVCTNLNLQTLHHNTWFELIKITTGLQAQQVGKYRQTYRIRQAYWLMERNNSGSVSKIKQTAVNFIQNCRLSSACTISKVSPYSWRFGRGPKAFIRYKLAGNMQKQENSRYRPTIQHSIKLSS